VSLLPHFSHTTYERRSADRYAAAHDDFVFFNERLQEELSALPGEWHAGDVVLVPTTSENHLLGYVRWMKSFSPGGAPRFVVHLMFPSGLTFTNGQEKVADPLRAMFYRLAFRAAAEDGPEIVFFGGGRQLGAEYTALAGMPIAPYAIPLEPRRTTMVAPRARPSALLFAGDAKPDKGFLLLPKIAAGLSAKFPGWDFVVHANTAIGGAPVRGALEALKGVASKCRNLSVREGRLTADDYRLLLASADLMLLPYDAGVYAGKSSGILWECLSLGIPVLVPRGTWLEREAVLWNGGYAAYDPGGTEAIVSAFGDMAQRLPELTAVSASASKVFRAQNGAEALLRQIVEPPSAAASAAPLTTSGLAAVAGGMMIRADSAKLAQHSTGDRFRHLDIVLFSVSAGAESWPRLKFKLVRAATGARLLEFRQGTGWPAMFHNWPSSEADRFGPVLRLPDDPAVLPEKIAAWHGAHDRRLLSVLAALLPKAVEAAMDQANLSADTRVLWSADAVAMAQSLENALEDSPAQSASAATCGL
jgi:glycosyltransferase involved in cell wall biosynthesis